MKITIGKKLTISTVVNLSLLAIVSIVACLASLRVTSSTDALISPLRKMEVVDNLQFAIVESIKMNDFLISGDLEKKTAFELSVLGVEGTIEDVEQLELDLTERANLVEIKRQFNLLSKTTHQICDEAVTSDKGFLSESINSLVEDADEIAVFIVEASESIHDSLNTKIADANLKNEHAKQLSLITTVSVSILAVFLGIGGSIILARNITKPIVELASAAKTITEGNFDKRVNIISQDEIGQLANAFNYMTAHLKDIYTNLEEKVNERTVKLTMEIAERKRAEQSLETSNRDLKDFVHIASHDLREPSRKVSSFGEILAESLAGKLNDDEQENLNFMINGAERMQQMVDSLLVYSRVTTKDVTFEEVDLNEMIEQLKDLELANNLKEANGSVLVPEPLLSIDGDVSQTRQLLQNLITNALKYRKKDVPPEITIRTHKQDDNMVRVEVQDNGIGIEEKQYKNIFVMFRRLHSRQKYDGTGIGLAVCKKIVERHNGEIGVSSTYGQGTTFWFTVPVAKTADREQEQLVSSLNS